MRIGDFIGRSLTESKGYISQAVKGLSTDELTFRPQRHSNSIAFLLWHLARIEDLWINKILLEEKEIYELESWYKKFGTPAQDSGFGYDVEKLDAWPIPSLELLEAYAAAVRQKTQAYISTLNMRRMDELNNFLQGKGTIGLALSHLVTEVAEHTGQIGYIRGIIKGIEPPTTPRVK